MELREYAGTILKWWWLILLATAIAAVASWYVAKDQPPIYQTSTTLMIGQAIQEADPNYQDFYAGQQLAQTYAELIQREPILKTTAAALGFEERWRVLKGQVAVNLVPGTQLMEIRVTDNDPQRAKLIADEVARQLLATVERTRPQDANRAFIENQAASLPPKIEAAQTEIVELQTDLSTAFSARQIQDIQNRIRTLEQQTADWQSTFAQYRLLLGDTATNVLTVIEEASLPVAPIGPNWMLQVVLAAAIGAALAVAAAFVIEYLDDSLRTKEDLERATGLTTLAIISQMPGNGNSQKPIAASDPRSPISEAYRSLRTSLRFSSPDEPLNALVVSSASAQEGKTTTAANLAVVLAQDGNQVILVDADMRRPRMHRVFGLANRTGLTNALIDDEIVLDGRLQETEVPNLRVLTTGPLPPNPSELLGSGKMKHLIQSLKAEAAFVIFDTPPVLPVTDAAVLAPQVDGVLLVTESGRTREGALRQALETMERVNARILGLALNRMQVGGRGRYDYYNDYYYSSETDRNSRKPRGWRRLIPSPKRGSGR